MGRCVRKAWILWILVYHTATTIYGDTGVCTSNESPIVRVTWETFISTSKLYHMSLLPETGGVFLGGQNSVHKLSSNLSLLQTFTYPKKDENPVKLILFDNDYGVLVACGTANQGMCYRHDLNDISGNVTFLNGADQSSGHILSSRGSTAGVVSQNQMLHSGSNTTVFYFGRTLDSDLLYGEQQSVSTKVWNSEMDGFKLASNVTDIHIKKSSEISVSEKFSATHKIDYIYAFMHNGFTYFVTRQPKKLGSKSSGTRLLRVCAQDVGYYSYMELTLNCKSKTIKGAYTVPIDAFFAEVSSDYVAGKKLEYSSVLFLLSARDDSDEVSAHGGQVVCGFSMTEVDAAFDKAILDCQNQISYRPGLEFMFDDEPRRCIPTRSQEVNSCPAVPGHLNNLHVEKSLNEKNILLDENSEDLEIHDLTSIAVTIYGDNTVLVGGTAKGEIKIFHIGALVGPRRGVPSVKVKISKSAISQNLDLFHDDVFAMTDTSVHKFSLALFCQYMQTCRDCLVNAYLQCGYCTGFGCATENDCKDFGGSWSKTMCPAIVSSISPRSAPLQGGTEITICGQALGHTAPDATKPTVRQVSLGDKANCTMSNMEDYNKITCILATSDVLQQSRSVLRVPISIKMKAPLPVLGYEYDHFGIDETLQPGYFSFYPVKFTEFYPKKGSDEGGTVLTVVGQYLDVGSKASVTVGTSPCAIFSRSTNQIQCVTSSQNATRTAKRDVDKSFHNELGAIKEATKPVQVNVSIDNAVSILPGTFAYMPSPTLNFPANTIFRSIYSGGIHILILGVNLDSVAKPYVTLKVKTLEIEQNVTCTVVAGPSGMKYLQFITPSIKTTTSHYNGSLTFLGQVTFHLDNLQVTNSIMAWLDPVFQPCEMLEQNGKVTVVVEYDRVRKFCQQYMTYLQCDFKMYIGDLLCPKLKVSKGSLVCEVERTILEEQSKIQKREVYVHLGLNFKASVGEINLANPNSALVGGIVGALLVVVVVIAVLVVMKCRSKKKPSSLPPVTFSRQDSDVHTGNAYSHSTRNGNRLNSDLAPLLSRPSIRERLAPGILEEMSPLLIEPEHVVYDRDNIIGKGNFGIVFHGNYYPPNETERSAGVKVAIKTMSRIEDVHSVEQFLKEALIMKDFKDVHVLTLIGVIMDENSCPMVVLPFMKHGDLLMFIRNPESRPTVKDLVGFGLQACKGMKYLASNRFVHRDLAARNCMLDEDYTVKVADFGLARDIYEKEYYKPHDRIGRMPVKWMALESLQQQKFTMKTDVWSFGILMWELLTRGVTPYPDVDAFDVLEYILDGRRLKQPEFCSDELYQVILRCWNPLPEDRPTFAELVLLIADIHKNIHGMHYPGLNVTYVNLDTHPYPSQIRSSESHSTGASDVFTPGTDTTFVRSATGPAPPPRNPIPSHDAVFSPGVPPPSQHDILQDEQGYLLPSVSGTPTTANRPSDTPKTHTSHDDTEERQHLLQVSENGVQAPNSASPKMELDNVNQYPDPAKAANVDKIHKESAATAANPSLRKQDSFAVPPSPLQAPRVSKVKPAVAPKPKYVNEGMGVHKPLPVPPDSRYQNISRDSPDFLSNPTYVDRKELLKEHKDACAAKADRNRNNGNNRDHSNERYVANPRLSAEVKSAYVELAEDHSPDETSEV